MRAPATRREVERPASELPESLADLRRRVAERLASVNELTEREVLAAGKSVHEIVDHATKHITWLRDVLHRVGGGDHAVNRAIEDQSALLGEYAADIRQRVAEHDQLAQKAVAQAANTLAAGGEIATLARQAKMLALNARIEAVRSGDQVRSFAVIADEMARLSKAVAVANEQVQQLAASLGAILPAMAAQTSTLRQRAEDFAVRASEQIADLKGHVAAIRDDVTATAAASDETLARVISDSHDALSHLQFQDVAAQRLLYVDSWLRDVQVAVVTEVAGPQQVEEIAPPVHSELGGGVVESSTPAGEVQLF
jgi:methyl-accepting chemotaxis protein